MKKKVVIIILIIVAIALCMSPKNTSSGDLEDIIYFINTLNI